MRSKLGSQKKVRRNEIVNMNATASALPQIYYKFLNDSPPPRHDAVFIDEGQTDAVVSYQAGFKHTMKHGFAVNQRKISPSPHKYDEVN